MPDRRDAQPDRVESRDARETLTLDEPLLLLLTSAVDQSRDQLGDPAAHREFVEATVRYVRDVERYMSHPQLRSRFHDRLSRLLNVLGQYVIAQALQAPTGARAPETTAIFDIAARVREFALTHERHRVAMELPESAEAIRMAFGIDPEEWRTSIDERLDPRDPRD